MGVLPYALDDVMVRLRPAWDASLAFGPGGRGREAGASMLFEAGAGIRSQDLFAAFWLDELPIMNWFRDFLCDPDMDGFLDRLANPPPEEQEEEILFSKSQLATVGSDVMEEY